VTAVHTRARVAGVLLLATALAGCGSAGQAPAPPAEATATAASVAPPAPTTATPAPVPLPWPAATAAQAASLQTAVDGGAQPWLLDPTQVALAYAAARGWADASAVDTTAAGVTIRSSAGTHVLTLAQPGKTGTAGIWVVTADR
jgi:hypothetical protein